MSPKNQFSLGAPPSERRAAGNRFLSLSFRVCALVGLIVQFSAALAFGDDYLLKTDATWRTIKGSLPVGADWNSSVIYDDSDAAGWTNAFKSPNGDRIWHTSNLSSESPANPRFRHVFSLSGPVSSAVGHFYFDDDGTVWINGVEVLNDTSGGASTFDNVGLDPSLFHPGDNLIAVWGHNTIGPFNNIEVDITLSIIPEPGALGLLSVGITLVSLRLTRHKAKSSRSPASRLRARA